MENPKLLKGNFKVLLIAVAFGATIPVLLLLGFNWAGEVWGRGSGDDAGPKNILFLAMVLSIPIQWLSDVTGISPVFLNPYIVYGLFGAAFSLGVVLLWKLITKE